MHSTIAVIHVILVTSVIYIVRVFLKVLDVSLALSLGSSKIIVPARKVFVCHNWLAGLRNFRCYVYVFNVEYRSVFFTYEKI